MQSITETLNIKNEEIKRASLTEDRDNMIVRPWQQKILISFVMACKNDKYIKIQRKYPKTI